MILTKVITNSLPYGLVCAVKRVRQAEVRKETHINRAIQATKGTTYVEIGISDGACFRQITAPRKIGIDPAPRGFGTNLGPGESFFKMTSDEFFSQRAAEVLQSGTIDVALVDGLHEFDQALRDVLNLERYISPSGVIFMHDCNPLTPKHEGPAYDGIWNGDVWKVAYYVKRYRPDLSFFTLDCDQGVGVVTGFKRVPGRELPSSLVLDECRSLDYDYLKDNRSELLHLSNPYFSRYFFWKHKARGSSAK
jgi:hypothetical protein